MSTRLWEPDSSAFLPDINLQVVLRCTTCKQHRVAVIRWEEGEETDPRTHQTLHRNMPSFVPSFLQNAGLTFLTSLKIKSPIECRTQTTFDYDYMCTSPFFLFLWRSRVTYRLHMGS